MLHASLSASSIVVTVLPLQLFCCEYLVLLYELEFSFEIVGPYVRWAMLYVSNSKGMVVCVISAFVCKLHVVNSGLGRSLTHLIDLHNDISKNI